MIEKIMQEYRFICEDNDGLNGKTYYRMLCSSQVQRDYQALREIHDSVTVVYRGDSGDRFVYGLHFADPNYVPMVDTEPYGVVHNTNDDSFDGSWDDTADLDSW